ncbi:MAG: hypothetical protein RIC84_25070 [Aggregatilineales bacterium]
MASIIIALSTYGSQRVKHPHSGQMISAYKMGYSSAASAVLLALYGDQARDVSSKHASYHYIQIDSEVTVRHGYILLKITAEELAKAEAITRKTHRPAVYRWQENVWQEFPCINQADYTTMIGRSGPDFNPTGMLLVSASTGEAESAIAGITVEKSQRSPSDTPWHWLRGDTYPHRDLLKRWGCRWSKKRKAWYYMGATLPDAVQQLIDELETTATANEDDHDPCSIEEAAEVLGLQVKSEPLTPQPEHPPRLFDLNETVYARHDLETLDGKAVPTGTSGVITRLYNRNGKHGWSYDVDFTGIGTGWFFERELSSLEPIAGIRITHGSVVPPGAVSPLSDMEIKRNLLESGHQPEAIEDIELLSDKADDIEEDEPKIRIIKPNLDVSDGEEADAVITAVRQTKLEVLPVLQSSNSPSSGRRNLVRIPQAVCGELTGSITGSVWCYGYGIHDGICVYLNMGGPRMAVEAIRAKLAKGDIVSCVPWDAPSVELTAGEGNTGMYSAFMQNIPEAKFTSLILCHELLTQPNYGGASTTFMIHVSDEQAMAQLHQHITKLVKVAVFPEWTGYLWDAGQRAMLLRTTRTGGDVKLWTISLNDSGWTRLITGGLAQNIIRLPQNL